MESAERITITTVFNPFDLNERTTEAVRYEAGKSIGEYINEKYPDTELFEFAIGHNSRVLKEEEVEDSVLRPGDFITICAIPRGGGGGGKNIFRTVAMVAIMIIATYVTAGGAAAAGGWFAAGSASAAMAGAAIAVGGSMLVNAIFPVPTPDLGMGSFSSEYSDQSSNYSWDVKNPVDEGGPCPVLYGRRRIAPQLISKYITTAEDNKQHLNMLFLVHDGFVSFLDEVEVNSNPIENFTDIETDYRLGEADQEVIDYFNDTIFETLVNAKLDESLDTASVDKTEELGEGWSELVQTEDNTSRLSIKFHFPNGLGKLTYKKKWVNDPSGRREKPGEAGWGDSSTSSGGTKNSDVSSTTC